MIMEMLSIFLLANLLLLIMIVVVLVFFARAKKERYQSNKTARELQKLKKQII